jgi:MFS family permease
MGLGSILDRSHSVAEPGFSRWMVPPAALCIHLCIGQAYAFSVFNLPMSKLIGITKSAPDDWKLTDVGWIFSIAIFFLGFSAAVLGRWVEEGGPRRAMFAAALCFSGGLLISAFGVSVHQLWIVYLGYGVLGGIGLGLGYISPVSTLIKWFPDRPGMATGMAIMGFGGAAMIAAPLSVWLMSVFSTPTHVGVAETFVVLGIVYAIFMLVGAAIVRLPAPGWTPEGFVAPTEPKKLVTTKDVYVYQALKTPHFWFIWIVLCMNVTAGIGVLGQASAMSRRCSPAESPRRPPAASSGCSASSTWPDASSGPRHRTTSAARTPILSFSHWGSCSMRSSPFRRRGEFGAVRAGLRHHPEHVRRRLRYRAGLSQGHVRHPLRRRNPWHADYGVVSRGRARSGACSVRCSSTTSGSIRSTAACQRPRCTTSRCTLWPDFWSSGLSPTS